MVGIRATTENKLSKTREEGKYVERTTYKLSSIVRHRLKSWRVKRHYHFRRFCGVHWKAMRVWLFPLFERSRIEEWLKQYEREYYLVCKDIPDEDDRKKFKFRVEYGEYIPIQPESSTIIARMIQETLEEIRHDVGRLREAVGDYPTYIELVKRNEVKIADTISTFKRDYSEFSWSNESIMLFANVLALLGRNDLDEAICRRLKTNVAKLKEIISPFDHQIKAVLDLVYDGVTASQSIEKTRVKILEVRSVET